MRAALYARYSSDQQRATSISDQQRICRDYATRQGWRVVADYEDAALSGASLLRPGFQALMAAALAGAFDIVLAESLDRLSRDLEDTAALFKRLTFVGVRIVTVSEGDIGRMHVGLKGLMSELFLHDLADKTRRGLRGRVEAGRSGGGLSYGYRVTRAQEGQSRGGREIHPQEAATVLRIFQAFVAGVSPKAIAKTLNAEGIAGPRGATWSPSTIHGHTGRRTGILNNDLYVGKLIWNRQRFEKDPVTRKRQARMNPPDAWIVKEVPELRIIPDDLWQAVKARQAAAKATMKAGIVRARRPKYLFSGLTRCESCGGGFVVSSHNLLTCFNARSRGTCTNRRSIRREDVENRVLRAIQERFLEPHAFQAFCEGFAGELASQRREHLAKVAAARAQLGAVERRQGQIMESLVAGYRSEAWKAELERLDEQKATLTALVTQPPLPSLNPKLGDIFRGKAKRLVEDLARPDRHDAARSALRGLLETIVIPAGDGLLQVIGNPLMMLSAASAGSGPLSNVVGYVGCGGGI